MLTGVGGQCTRRGRPVQWRTRTHTHAPTHTQVGYCFLPKAQSSPGRSRRSAGARRKTGRRGESSRLEGNIVFEGRFFCVFFKTKLRGPSGAAAPLACDSAIQVEEQVAADGLYPRTTWLGNREKSCGHLGALTGAFGWLVCLLGGIHPDRLADRGLILELF